MHDVTHNAHLGALIGYIITGGCWANIFEWHKTILTSQRMRSKKKKKNCEHLVDELRLTESNMLEKEGRLTLLQEAKSNNGNNVGDVITGRAKVCGR